MRRYKTITESDVRISVAEEFFFLLFFMQNCTNTEKELVGGKTRPDLCSNMKCSGSTAENHLIRRLFTRALTCTYSSDGVFYIDETWSN